MSNDIKIRISVLRGGSAVSETTADTVKDALKNYRSAVRIAEDYAPCSVKVCIENEVRVEAPGDAPSDMEMLRAFLEFKK